MPKAFPDEFRSDVVAVAREDESSIVQIAKFEPVPKIAKTFLVNIGRLWRPEAPSLPEGC